MKKSASGPWFLGNTAGISYGRILRYFYPEFITALIVYFLPQFIDCYFICTLKSTELYAISGLVENLLSIFTKGAEGFLIGTVIISGYYNGLQEYQKAGQSFATAFWITLYAAIFAAIGLLCGVAFFYNLNHFSPHMIELGSPYLKIKAVGVFFMFAYFALVGFFRSVKNTFTPMAVFVFGNICFITFDYLLIFGKAGFPALGLLGSAIAYLLQYVIMSILMLGYLLTAKKYAAYKISLVSAKLDAKTTWKFLKTTIPVVIDKVSIAFAYNWLACCISPLGATAIASFSMIKLMERIAFVPAIAFSQIITFLVSNDIGKGNWDAIFGNIRKVVLLASAMVGIILIVGSLFPYVIVNFYGCAPEMCNLVSAVFPSLSILVMFDLMQLILSGVLRGAGDVKTVMITRLIVIFGYFIPMTYVLPLLPVQTVAAKMLLMYVTFLMGNAFMTIVYAICLKKNYWNKRNERNLRD